MYMKNKIRIKNFFLYGLYCPYTNELKYVGITTGKLNDRLGSHLRNPTNFLTMKWFKSLEINSIKNYLNTGLNQTEISKIYNCSNKIISKFIKNHHE